VNIVLWVLQVIVGLMFLAAGGMKVSRPKGVLQEQQPWVEDFSQGTVRTIGWLEILGAIGLIIPALTGFGVLVPLAAIGLGLTQIGAIFVHARRGEYKSIVVNVVIIVMVAVIIWGRFGPESL
jgi:uncharacterized membrane protein YphA (DoxX/SURF4 family)